MKNPDFLDKLRRDMYQTTKFATPQELRRLASFQANAQLAEKWRRMADRRDFAFDIYKMICKEIDDEGDVEEFGGNNGQTEQ